MVEGRRQRAEGGEERGEGWKQKAILHVEY